MKSNPYHTGEKPVSRKQSEEGFTLSEVLVTLALTSVLAMIMVAMISQLRSIKSAQELNDVTVEAEALADYLKKTLEQALPLPLSRNNPQKRMFMTGTGKNIHFVGVTRTGSRSMGLRDITIRYDNSDRKAVKLLQSLSLRRNNDNDAEKTLYLSQIDNIDILYFKPDNTEQDSKNFWVDEWHQDGALPRWIQFKITLTRGRTQVTTQRTVRIRASALNQSIR